MLQYAHADAAAAANNTTTTNPATCSCAATCPGVFAGNFNQVAIPPEGCADLYKSTFYICSTSEF